MSNHKEKLKKHWIDKGYFVINMIRITPIGLPDYIFLNPNHVVFVESKEKGDRLSALQKIWLNRLTRRGFECYVNDKKWSIIESDKTL